MSCLPTEVKVTSSTPGKAAMTSKGAKETIVTRLGFKSSSSGSKAEAELDKVRKENAHLRKKIDELAKRHVKPPDSDKSKLLEVKDVLLFCLWCSGMSGLTPEFDACLSVLAVVVSSCVYCVLCLFQRILSLETLRERNNQQLLVKEQELETLRQQLTARGGEVCNHDTSLQRYMAKKITFTVNLCGHIHLEVYTQNRFGQPEAALSCPGCVDIPTAVGFFECTLQVVNICCTFGIVLVAYVLRAAAAVRKGRKKIIRDFLWAATKTVGGEIASIPLWQQLSLVTFRQPAKAAYQHVACMLFAWYL